MIIRALAILLAAQLALTALLYWPRESGPVSRSTLLADLGEESLSTLTIEADDGDGVASIKLLREAAGWRMESGYPADESKVSALLDALLSSDPGYAIANTETAAKRFEVQEDNFQRRLILGGSAGERRIYLGNSPSFRKIHARVDGEDGIFILAFNSFDAPANEAGWLDRDLLAVRDPQGLRLDGSDYRLADGQWRRESDPEHEIDGDAMTTLVSVLAGLRVTGLANAEETRDASTTTPLLQLQYQLASPESVSMDVFAYDERFFLRSSAYAALFSTSAYDAERLLEAAQALSAEAPQGPVAEAAEPALDTATPDGDTRP